MKDFSDWGPVVGPLMMLIGLIGLLIDCWKKGCFFFG